MQMGDVTVSAGGELHLRAGTYSVNSLTLMGGGKIVELDQRVPVIFKVKGDGIATPLDLAGGGVKTVNESVESAVRLRRSWPDQGHRRYQIRRRSSTRPTRKDNLPAAPTSTVPSSSKYQLDGRVRYELRPAAAADGDDRRQLDDDELHLEDVLINSAAGDSGHPARARPCIWHGPGAPGTARSVTR